MGDRQQPLHQPQPTAQRLVERSFEPERVAGDGIGSVHGRSFRARFECVCRAAEARFGSARRPWVLTRILGRTVYSAPARRAPRQTRCPAPTNSKLPAVRGGRARRRHRIGRRCGPSRPPDTRPDVPMLWRVFAANAAVFAIAFALLALSPVTIHAPIRLVELVILLGGPGRDAARRPAAAAPGAQPARPAGEGDGQRSISCAPVSARSGSTARAVRCWRWRRRSTRCSSGSRTERRESSGRVLAAQEAGAAHGSPASCTTRSARR